MQRLWDKEKRGMSEELETANVTVVQRVRQTVRREETQLGHIIQDLEDDVECLDFDP